MTKGVQTFLSILLTTLLVMVVALPALGQTRRTPAKPAPKPATPPPPATPYEQGYGRGYDAGYKAGQDDYGRGTPRDLRNNAVFQNREQNYDPKFADSEEYRQAYTLGVEFGYMDGYYGRTRSAAVPANGAVLAKAAALAAAQRERREAYRRDDQPRNDPPRNDTRRDEPRRDDARRDTRASGPLNIPAGTQLNLRLTS